MHKAGALTKEEFDLEKKKILEKPTTHNTPIQSSDNSNKIQNPFELMIVDKFNQEHGTNFLTMKEVQQYLQSKQN